MTEYALLASGFRFPTSDQLVPLTNTELFQNSEVDKYLELGVAKVPSILKALEEYQIKACPENLMDVLDNFIELIKGCDLDTFIKLQASNRNLTNTAWSALSDFVNETFDKTYLSYVGLPYYLKLTTDVRSFNSSSRKGLDKCDKSWNYLIRIYLNGGKGDALVSFIRFVCIG